jgi:hypothetical protein
MKTRAVPTFFLLLAALPSGTAQSKNIHEIVDPYSRLRTLVLEVQTKACPGEPSIGAHDASVTLLFSAEQLKSGGVLYLLTPALDGGPVLNLRKDGTMDTLIDGVVGSLGAAAASAVTTQYERGGGRSYLHETVPFVVSREFMAKLGNAAQFQFRLNGAREPVQRCTDAKHLRDMPEFLDEAAVYGPPLDPEPSAATTAEAAKTPETVKAMRVTAPETHACAGDPAIGPGDPVVRFSIRADRRADHTVRYYFITDLTERTPLGVRSKGGLETVMDGSRQTYPTPHGSTIEAAAGGVVHENIEFHVDRRDLRALSKSTVFEFRILGPQQSVHRCMYPTHFTDLAGFINATAALHDHPVGTAASTPPQ